MLSKSNKEQLKYDKASTVNTASAVRTLIEKRSPTNKEGIIEQNLRTIEILI